MESKKDSIEVATIEQSTTLVTRPSIPIETLMEKALAQGSEAVQGLETLFKLWQAQQAENARLAFHEAMAGFQAECPVIATVKEGFEYKYAPIGYIIEVIRPLCQKWGFSYRFDASVDWELNVQTCYCIVTHSQGHSEVSKFELPAKWENKRTNPGQQVAGSNSYGRRYALRNAFGLVTENDDDLQGWKPKTPLSKETKERFEELYDQIPDDYREKRIDKYLKAYDGDVTNAPEEAVQSYIEGMERKIELVKGKDEVLKGGTVK